MGNAEYLIGFQYLDVRARKRTAKGPAHVADILVFNQFQIRSRQKKILIESQTTEEFFCRTSEMRLKSRSVVRRHIALKVENATWSPYAQPRSAPLRARVRI